MKRYAFLAVIASFYGINSNAQVTNDSACHEVNSIRCYLTAAATQITRSSLATLNSLSEWEAVRSERYVEFLEMMGLQGKLTNDTRPPVKVKRTGIIQQEGYRIEKLYYESMPHLYVTANLYIPDGLTRPAPAILYVCGHALTQKHHYQAHARSFAERGFVCLIIETIQRGEVKGEHLGAESLGWFHWYSKGYNPAGVEVWNGIRGLDLLCQLPEVDKDKLGVTGISGGGSQSWYLPAADSRIKAAAAVAGASSLEGQVKQRTIDDHCDCMMPINTYGIDFSDIGALIAPRPFLIAQTTEDGYYAIEAVRTLYGKLKPVYGLYDSPEQLSMVEAPGGHSYGTDEQLRGTVLSFFIKELMDKEIPPANVGPIDISTKLSEDELRVYVNGPPDDDITTTIQDSFVAVATPPTIKDLESLDAYRKEVVEFLKTKTFTSFPSHPTPLNIKLEFHTRDFSKAGREDYSFVPEPGWRLKFSLHRNEPKEVTSPILLVLVNPEEGRWDRYSLTAGLPNGINVAYFEARGIGETGWSPSRQWHIRRAAAWTGRTIASMRVYDVLRCLEAIRSVPGVDPNDIRIVAQGEMAAVAAYAALLDGHVRSLILKNPPPTQNALSSRDGRGMALEMLNCLQVTDLPQVAGLFFPGDFIALGEQPDSFKWVEELYKTLGSPGSYKHIEKLSEWTIKK